MIAVLADDFTGAAEIGAIALRHGLTAEVQTSFRPEADVDLVVVDTDSRSSTREDAVDRVAAEVDRLRNGRVDWIYKKVDSVLRGHVAAELGTMLGRLPIDRALLVPNNPSYGQATRGGRYTIDGSPLDETRFGSDPEYPAATARVLDLLGDAGDGILAWREPSERLPEGGIVVGGAQNVADLEAWARRIDGRTLAAGAAEFFGAALRARLGSIDGSGVERGSPPEGRALPGRILFVLGSTSTHRRTIFDRARRGRVPVVTMPVEVLEPSADGKSAIGRWVETLIEGLEGPGRAIVTFTPSQPDGEPRVPPRSLPGLLATITQAVLSREPDPRLHLCVEGGTTASTLVRRLGWSRFSVGAEEGDGVATLRIEEEPGRLLTVKPGSYPWPAGVLRWLD